MNSQQVEFLRNLGLVPAGSVKVEKVVGGVNPEILRKVRQAVTEKSQDELLTDLEEDEGAKFPNVQFASTSGSIPYGVWVDSKQFLKCPDLMTAKVICNLLKNVPSLSSH